MFGRFLPEQPLFYDFFEQHIKMTAQSAYILFELFRAPSSSFSETNENPIKKLEHEADIVAYQCIDTLHKSFITPLQHHDIFRLISNMDDIIDCIDEVWGDCLIYHIQDFTPEAKELSSLLVEVTDKLDGMIHRLRDRKKNALFIT